MITVIIPTYKPGAYLWKCLDSLESQTIEKSLYEVIVILNGCREPYATNMAQGIGKYSMNVRIEQTDTPGVSNARNIGIDMAGIGPFIPHPETPLAHEKGGTLNLALRTMAVMRLMMPDINIPATTAMESLHPKGRLIALQSGANVVMPNVTEGEYRKLYELYPGKICVNDTPAHCRSCIGLKITSIGRTIGTGYGCRKGKTIQ